MSTQVPPTYFVVPVWGEAYVKVFTEVCLPAQLSPGNIPALPNIGRCQYHIYTTKNDYAAVYQSASFKNLEKLINASIHVVEPPRSSEERYDKKSEIYRAAIRRAAKDDAVNFFLNADIVLADGFVRRVTELLAAGKRVIELPGPRTVKEAVRNELLQHHRDQNGAIAISPRRLAAMAIEHLHPLEGMHFWQSSGSDDRFHPSHLYWRVGKNSLLARCFHLYPIVVYPRDRMGAVRFDTTIDDDLVERACPAMEDTHVVTNSDDMFCCELSAAEHYVGSMGSRGSIDDVVDFCFHYGKERNAKLLKYKIRMVGGDEPEQEWKRAEGDSESVIGQVIDRAGIRQIYEDKQLASHTAKLPTFSPPAKQTSLGFDSAGAAIPARAPVQPIRPHSGKSNIKNGIGRPKLRMLVAVWGEHHSNLFLEFALPSLLASGNIPVLTEHFECDFEFLTMLEDVDRIRDSSAVKALSGLVSVHFTEIDDLQFRHSYGILLTYAFARGIAARKDEMTNTYFVFLNADFVFSDGSLRSMLAALQEGYQAVVVPSFRCISEDFTAQMRDRLEHTREGMPVLSLSGRSMVRSALDLIHPTFAAKTVNQDGPFTTLVNQFLWKVDDDTMVGRFYLLFMLCVKPEVPLDEVIGFCDYALVPQLVPSGNVKIFTDSDDVFLLELQHRDHEGGEYYVAERPGTEFLAERLSEWTTPLHRQYAATDLVFHAGKLPNNLRQVTAEARTFIDEIDNRLGPPRPYRDHEYWTGTFAALKVDPDGVPVLSRRQGMVDESVGRLTAGPSALRPKKFKKIAKNKHAKKLRRWAEAVEDLIGKQRQAIANLRDVRNRMSGKVGDLREQLNELASKYEQATTELRRHEQSVSDARRQQQSESDLKRQLTEAELRRQEAETELRQVLSQFASKFDRDYYVRSNPDVTQSGLDPQTHYQTIGWKRGSDPSPYFSVRGYLADNPDVAAAEMDPLEHFRKYGVREGRKGWRKAFVDQLDEPAENDIVVSSPVTSVRTPHSWIPSLFKRSKGLNRNEVELIESSGLFDRDYYLKEYPDVAKASCNPVEHYLRYGGIEGRQPSPAFDARSYLRSNPDVQAAGINPVIHWLKYGRHENRLSPLHPQKDQKLKSGGVTT
jgi:hypothetical protein